MGGLLTAEEVAQERPQVELALPWPMPIRGCRHGHQPIWMVKHSQRYQSQLLPVFELVIRASSGPEKERTSRGRR